MSIWRHVDALVLHIFGMVTWIKLMPMTLTLKKELINEFKATWRRLISDFRQIQSFQMQSAEGQSGMMGKNGSKGYHDHRLNNNTNNNNDQEAPGPRLYQRLCPPQQGQGIQQGLCRLCKRFQWQGFQGHRGTAELKLAPPLPIVNKIVRGMKHAIRQVPSHPPHAKQLL